MTTNKSEEIQIPNLGANPWPLFIQDSEDIPEGATSWGIAHTEGGYGRLVGYVKRFGRTNGGRAVWHIIPFTSAKDGSRWYSLYIS